MMEAFTAYIKTITALTIFSAMAEILMPEGNHRRYVELVLGVLILFSRAEPFSAAVWRKAGRYQPFAAAAERPAGTGVPYWRGLSGNGTGTAGTYISDAFGGGTDAGPAKEISAD